MKTKNPWVLESGEYISKTTPNSELDDTVDSAERIRMFIAGEPVKIGKEDKKELNEIFDMIPGATAYEDAEKRIQNGRRFDSMIERMLEKVQSKIEFAQDVFDRAKFEMYTGLGIAGVCSLLTTWVANEPAFKLEPDPVSPALFAICGVGALAMAGRGAFKAIQAKREEKKQEGLFRDLGYVADENDEMIDQYGQVMENPKAIKDQKEFDEKRKSQTGRERFNQMQRDIEGVGNVDGNPSEATLDISVKDLRKSARREGRDWFREMNDLFDDKNMDTKN